MQHLKNNIYHLLAIGGKLHLWYRKFLPEVLIIIVGFSATYVLKYVPYASILLGLIPTLPLIVTIFLILILLKPRLVMILRFAFLLLIASIPLTHLHLVTMADTLTEISYLLFFSVIVINFIAIIKEEK